MGTMSDSVDRYFEWRKRRPMQRSVGDEVIVKVDAGELGRHRMSLGHHSG